MLLLEDTRQQEDKHENKHNYFRSVGIYWNRTGLYCGDYTLPPNQSVCVDTKKDIQEIIGDIHVKKMPKKDVRDSVDKLCEEHLISSEVTDRIYHAICDDDEGRWPEREIDEICYENHVSEKARKEFQKLYVKREGFFHRGLMRAQNSGVKLYVLIENKDGVSSLSDLHSWENPRAKMQKWVTTPSGKRRKVLLSPDATRGETLAKAMKTMEEKYGVTFCFCHPDETGAKILELLGGYIAERK